jgi:hypothetical protein
VNPILAGVALAVTVGAVIAISAREARAALVGLAIALGAAPFLSDPLPQVSTLATRVVGAALTAYLLRAAVEAARPLPGRGPRLPGGSRIGWPAEALIAAAAWVVAVFLANGLAGLAPNGAPAPAGDVVAMLTPAAVTAAAGLASMIVAIVPAFGGRDALRTAVGSLILVQGVLVFRVGVAGPPGDLEQLGGVILLLAIGVAGAWLIGAERRRAEADAEGHDATPLAEAADAPFGPAR